MFFNTLVNPNAPIVKSKYLKSGSGSTSVRSTGSNTDGERRGPNIKTLPKPCNTGK